MRITSENKRIHRLVILVLIVLLLIPIVVVNVVFAAKTVTVLDGQVSVTDSIGNGSVSGGTVTITAKGGLLNKATNTITITNETENTATLSFDYTASKANSFKIADATANASGSYSVLLEAGGTLAITLVSNNGFSNTTATLTLKNFSLTAAAASSNVTVEYDSALGSVTAGGAAVSSGTVQNVSLTDGVALVATAKSGAKFLGWMDITKNSDNCYKRLDTSNSYTLIPASDMTVKAVFVKTDGTSNAWFLVDNARMTDDLNTATTLGTNIVLMYDGTLAAGNYTIPSGVTLLIPHDAAYTQYNENRDESSCHIGYTNWVKPTAFRTLTMATGANLTIKGTMNVSGKHCTAEESSVYGGAPSGPQGYVSMEANSSITVNGKLYAWGYIIGSGSVTVNKDAVVYENFQIMDFLGGTYTGNMDKSYEIFPFSQYYVQNIEVLTRFYPDATIKLFTISNLGNTVYPPLAVDLIGSNGLLKVENGYVTKSYDGSVDRISLDIYGDTTVQGISISYSLLFGAFKLDVNSTDYFFPIGSNWNFHLHSGTFSNSVQDMAFLPGARLTLDAAAKISLTNGVQIIVYDADQWGGYCGNNPTTFKPAPFSPTRTYTRSDADLVDAELLINGTVDASGGYLYTTTGGANIYSTGNGVIKNQAGTKTVTYQYIHNATNKYHAIDIVPSMLKNANATYVHSQLDTYTYKLEIGRWECSDEKHTDSDTNYICDRCGTFLEGYSGSFFNFLATNVNLGNNLDMLFAFPVNENASYAVFTRFGHEPVIVEIDTEKTVMIGNQECYYVAYSGFAAKEMCDMVYVHIYNSSNVRISECKYDGIREYAMRMLDKIKSEDDEASVYLRRVIVDMLNYGTACQEFFGYNTADKANANLTDAQKGYATKTDPTVTKGDTPSGVWAGSNLITDSNIQFGIAFNNFPVSDDGARYGYFTYYFTGHKGNKQGTAEEPIRVDFLDMTSPGSYHLLEGIVVADARSRITIAVYDEDGNLVKTWTESIESYVARNASNDTVFLAFMKFADSAKIYLYNKNS